MEAMELKSIDLDKFGDFKHGGRCEICKKIILEEVYFWQF